MAIGPSKKSVSASLVREKTSRRSPIAATEVDRPNRRRDILLAAAELFSEHGFKGVTFRDIAERAKVPVALCVYYFGKKDELFSAVFDHNIDHVRKRMALLRSINDSSSELPTLHGIIRAWAEPVIEIRAMEESRPFAVFVARAVWDNTAEVQAAIETHYDPVAFELIAALARSLPDRSLHSLIWAYEWALGALLMHVADNRVARLSKGKLLPGDASMLDSLIDFIVAGITSLPVVKNAPAKKRPGTASRRAKPRLAK